MSVGRRVAGAVLAAVLVAVVVVAGAGRADAARGPTVSWLSTGDSFAAGVGAGTGYSTGTELSATRCVQSRRAFGPLAADLLRRQRGWSIPDEAFSACIGFVATDFFNPLVLKGAHQNISQLAWTRRQANPPGGRFDVVTLSYGGNDLGFSDVLAGCLLTRNSWEEIVDRGVGGCRESEDEMYQRINALVEGRPFDVRGRPAGAGFGPGAKRITLARFYALMAGELVTDRGVLVVAGYPRLMAPSSSWGAWRGRSCNLFAWHEADLLGRAVERLDERMRAAVEEARAASGRDIRYLSRLDLFDGGGDNHHGACTRGVEWMNGLTQSGLVFGNGSPVTPTHSFHPNRLGYAATARTLIGMIEGDFPPPATHQTPESEPVPVPEPEPEVDVGPLYEPGEAFADDCVVAWPTAPLYASDSVSLRMSCVRVPGQFLFTDVLFPNPDLPITPSTGRVRVTGRVAGVAESGNGFRTLQVIADQIGEWRA